jgi:hypothetical protein
MSSYGDTMQTIDINQSREDSANVISAAQQTDVYIVEQGRVVPVLSKPRASDNFEAYWQERERLLSRITIDPNWDSTEAVSEDRDRA